MEDDVKTPLIPPAEIYGNINGSYSATTESNKSSLYGVIEQGKVPAPDTNGLPQVPVVSSVQEIKVYKRRWCILLLYSLVCFINAIVWNTWAPISNSVKKVFGWTNGDISLFANWGPIMNITMPIAAWMLDTKGLRWGVFISALAAALGSGVRCIPTPQPSTLHKWLIHAGQLINGIGGPVTCMAMPAISATWFPPHERATATAIPLMTKNVALAVSFIIGPLLVPDISYENGTEPNITTYGYGDEYTENIGSSNNISGITVEELKDDITFYMRLQAGVAAAVFLMVLVYFPKKPPTPPCISASVQREPFIAGLKLLVRKGNFWLMVLIAALVTALNNTWMAVLSLIVIPSGATQEEAGWVGFYALITVGITLLIVGRLGDFFARRMKLFISSLYFLAASMYLWFTLIYLKVLPYHDAFLYITVIVGEAANNAPFPLVLELSCDIAHPVGEGTSSGVINGVYSLLAGVLLFLMMIPGIGTMWLNCTFAAAMTLSAVLVLLVNEKHHRLEIDDTLIVERDENK